MMAENRTEVRTFITHYICDLCGEGRMEATGVVLTSDPPQYEHMCPNCSSTQHFPKQYPSLDHDGVEVTS